MNETLTYIVTALGCVLSLLSIGYLFFGKRIPENNNGAEKIKIGEIELKISTVLGAFVISATITTLPLVLYIVPPTLPLVNVAAEKSAESICSELKGKYKLRQEYIFLEQEDIRLRATHGLWEAKSCNILEDQKVALKGIDTTDFDIELVIDKEFKHIATGIFSYPSELLIQNGKLRNRTFQLATEKGRKLNCVNETEGVNADTCHGIEKSEINKKIDKALNIRNSKHDKLILKYCIPTIGEEAGVRILAFVCHDYTRVMKLWDHD